MANFSTDRPVPPKRFSPQAGNVGAQVAERSLRPGRDQQQPSERQPQGRSQQGKAPISFGHPQPSSQESQPQKPEDNRHLELVGQHFNMRSQGRDVPFMVWAGLTGNYRMLAKPGEPMFDILED